jgi:hypothetical protein
VSAQACCQAVSTGSSRGSNRVMSEARIAIGGPRPATLARRCLGVGGWIVPGGILALLPKCPACVAAYFAIASGIGISMTAAVYLRTGLVILCVASLVYCAASRGRHIVALLRPMPSQTIGIRTSHSRVPRPCLSVLRRDTVGTLTFVAAARTANSDLVRAKRPTLSYRTGAEDFAVLEWSRRPCGAGTPARCS